MDAKLKYFVACCTIALTTIHTKLSMGHYLMAHRLLLSALLFMMPVLAFSQKTKIGTISVFDTEQHVVPKLKLKVVFCEKVIEASTDDKGRIKYTMFEDTCTKVTVSVRSNLYMPMDTLIDVSESLDFQIILRPIILHEVGVVGYRRIAQEDAEKTVFRINTKGLLKSAKADMALRQVPNVIYNDGTFFLIGQQTKAKILVNNIEVTELELSKIDATDIEKVELRQIGLNSDHQSGEINILLKKKLPNLYKGEVEMGANLLHRGSSISPSFTYRTKVIDLITWGTYVDDRQNSRYDISRNDKEVFHSENNNHLQQYSAMSKMNIFFTPQWRTSLSYSFFGYQSPADVSSQMKGITQPKREVKESYFSNFANLVVRHDKSANERFFLKARYFNYLSKNRSTMPATLFRGQMDEFTCNFQYELDSLSWLKKNHSFAVGYKSVYRNSILTSSNTSYVSDVQQFYLKDNVSFNKALSLFVLARGEWDGYKFEHGATQRTLSFLPYITLKYKHRIGSLSASYTRSIERPNIDYLNPDTFFINELTQIKGNPDLKSQHADKYTLNYSKQIKDSYLTAVVSYSDIKNSINQIYSEDYNVSTYENIGSGQVLKFDISYSKPLFSQSLNLNLSTGTGYLAFKINPNLIDRVLSKENKGWYFKSSVNLSYTMPQNWFVNLSMNYMNKDITFNATYYKKPMVNLLLTKSLLQNKLDISLQYTDMFGIYGKQRIVYNFKNIDQTATYSLPISRLVLSFAYRIGKQFKSRSVGRTIDNDDITTK